jgi:hypothetical protein
MHRLKVFEIFLLQVIVYIALWLWNDFIASYMSLVFCSILVFVLVISIIADLLEPSRIGRKYFYAMGVSIFAPILVAAFFVLLQKGELAWMQGL